MTSLVSESAVPAGLHLRLCCLATTETVTSLSCQARRCPWHIVAAAAAFHVPLSSSAQPPTLDLHHIALSCVSLPLFFVVTLNYDKPLIILYLTLALIRIPCRPQWKITVLCQFPSCGNPPKKKTNQPTNRSPETYTNNNTSNNHQIAVDNHGALPLPVVRQIAAQLASAVEHMHAHGVVHRDLTPAHILALGSDVTGPNVEIKILDFGHSCGLDHEFVNLYRSALVLNVSFFVRFSRYLI
ncbi:hypothetical protein T492DRAFT_345382 [Pavlovales sp. CCMP2436]|nr:hypothetical protein T492DRAFT_345382 [Pavlovales sp. CCMP2436]